MLLFQDTINSFSTFGERFLDAVTRYWVSFIQSLPGVIVGIVIIILGIFLAGRIAGFFMRRIHARTQDPLMSRFLGKGIRFLLIVLVIILALQAAGLGEVSSYVFAAAGASAVILGFAFKDVGQNFIAGIILSFNRPFDVNDTVEIGENFGKVKMLEFRYTKLKTFDGKDVYIPNADVITRPVVNYTEDGFYRWDFVIGIAYEENIEGAKKVVMDALATEPAVINDGIHENFVIEDELAASTVNLKVFFWVETKDFRRMALTTKGNVVRAVKEALEDHGFYMPAEIKEIKIYGKEREIPLSVRNNQDNSATSRDS